MTSASEALVFINRLQAGLQELSATHPSFAMATLSFGIAESPRHGRTPTAVLAAPILALPASAAAGTWSRSRAIRDPGRGR